MAEAPLKPAWILHRRPYQEGRLLVELLTRDEGKVTAVWRKPKRGFQGEPYVPLLARWSGKGSVLTLSKVEPVSAPIRLEGRFLYMGLYINELCYRLLGPSSSQALFSAYQECLISLSREQDAAEALRAFEHALLQELGVFPEVSVDTLANPVDPNSWYRFNQNSQFELVGVEQKNTFLGSVLLGLEAHRYDGSLNPLFRYLVDLALGGRQLESRRLYESLFAKQTESH